MEVSGQVHTQPLYHQGTIPLYTLDRRLGGPQSWSGHSDEEKNSQPLLGFKHPFIQPVAQCYTTDLSQLLFQVSRNKKHWTGNNFGPEFEPQSVCGGGDGGNEI
jgi:hypothetical protein